MTKVTNDLLYEILKRVQADLAELKNGQRDLKEGQIAIRDDIHAARGAILRHERALATMEADIDRIKFRLDLSDG